MSEEKKKANPGHGVTERLCEARRQTLEEKIDGLKTAIYATGAAISTFILILELIKRFMGA